MFIMFQQPDGGEVPGGEMADPDIEVGDMRETLMTIIIGTLI